MFARLIFMLVVLATVAAVPVAALAVVRERSRVRRSGMSPARPVCASCLYPLGSWSTPRCPGVRRFPPARWSHAGLTALMIPPGTVRTWRNGRFVGNVPSRQAAKRFHRPEDLRLLRRELLE